MGFRLTSRLKGISSRYNGQGGTLVIENLISTLKTRYLLYIQITEFTVLFLVFLLVLGLVNRFIRLPRFLIVLTSINLFLIFPDFMIRALRFLLGKLFELFFYLIRFLTTSSRWTLILAVNLLLALMLFLRYGRKKKEKDGNG